MSGSSWHALAGAVLLVLVCSVASAEFPPPFSRVLKVDRPFMTGKDVDVVLALLPRTPGMPSFDSHVEYDHAAAMAVRNFQMHFGLPRTGEVDERTATAILELLSDDNYRDDGKPASARGYMYKVHIAVHRNRSIEVPAILYDANNTVLLNFTVRTHGKGAHEDHPWPDFNNTDPGMSCFASDGNTPTGLHEFDLNTPEPDPKSYGPYPVNRAVLGLEGNAKIVTPHLRYGILLHTGEWPGWTPQQSMPNSEGCIHAHPDDIKRVAELLQARGVVAHKNPFGQLPYPYKPQGLLSVELIH
eukprot:m.14141 g.14141  ORF g.14141 m.14141 type:complete len:300 (-) comp3346_c0_seq2:1744-2643(-)